MLKNIKKFAKLNENLNHLTQTPHNNSSQEFNPPNDSGFFPIATPRSTVNEIMTGTTTSKNVEVFEKLNIILTTDGFRHITGTKDELAD